RSLHDALPISVLLPESFRGGCSFGAVRGYAGTVSPDTTSRSCISSSAEHPVPRIFCSAGRTAQIISLCFYSSLVRKDSPEEFGSIVVLLASGLESACTGQHTAKSFADRKNETGSITSPVHFDRHRN